MTIRLARSGLRFPADTAGADDAPLVLCLHGFPDTRATFANMLPALADAGLRAVAPTLRGYDPGAIPVDGDYSLPTLAADVLGWLDTLGVARAHIVGHDWGAVIGYATASLAPERVISLTALAIPPLQRLAEQLARRPALAVPLRYMLAFQRPGAEAGLMSGATVDTLWRRWSPDLHAPQAQALARSALATRPTAKAALTYYRQLLRPGRRAARSWALLRRPVDVPTRVLYGDRDGCMPAALFRDDRAHGLFSAGIDVEGLDGAGHFLHLERPDVVRQRIVTWCRRHG